MGLPPSRALFIITWAVAVGGQCANGPKSGTNGFAAYGACNTLSSGQVCVPNCAPGYSVQGSFVLQCDSNQQYDATGATCVPNSCGNGPSANADPNAVYTSCLTQKTGDTCTPTCASGYSPSGTSFSLVCIASAFDAAGFTCSGASCSGGPTNPNALADYTSCNALASGQLCTPTCASGYTSSGGFTLNCAGGQYTATTTCSPNTCSSGPSSNTDPNADYTNCNTLSTGQTCTPSCSAGFTVVGSISLVCNTGKYDAAGATCSTNACTGGPTTGADPSADYTKCNAMVSGQVCIPTCNPGTIVSGSFVLRCTSGKYDATGAVCSASSCASGPSANADPQASYTSCNALSSGQKCTPQCKTGYTLSGSFTLSCTGGTYDAAGATCTANACTSGPSAGTDPQATYTSCNSMVTGQVCTPQCASGYTPSGSLTLSCTTLRYDASGVTCLPTDCAGGPTTPAANAVYTLCNAKVSGQTCVPDCNTGYTVSGSFKLQCVGGKYSATGATCVANSCVNGPITGADPKASYSSCNSLSTGQICTPTCASGYTASGSFTLLCKGLNYDASGSTCTANACTGGPSLNGDAAAVYTGCNTLVTGDTCTPSCTSGYTQSGSFTLSCDASSKYNAAGASCIPNACTKGPNSNIDGAATYTACNSMVSGQTCTPTCATGFTLVGSIKLVCNNLYYSAYGASCSANSCSGGPSANADPNAQYTACNSYISGKQCTPTCNAGYTVSGSFTLTCTGTQYDAAGATCTANACTNGPSSNADANAVYTSCNSLKTGQTCTPTCNTGYTVSGSFTLACTALTYPAAGATCVANPCTGGPSSGSDAQAVYTSCNTLKTGQTCTPTCNVGYTNVGSFSLVCTANQYDASGAVCSNCVNGPSANADPNADYSSCNKLKSGATCTPTCATGYTISGSFTLTCVSNMYDATGATCTAGTCTGGPSANSDPQAVYTACNALTTGKTCSPTCNSGYTPSGSFTLNCVASKYDAAGATCTPNTCLNGASLNADANAIYTKCNSLVSGQTCIPECKTGYNPIGQFVLLCNSDQYSAAGASCAASSCSGGPLVATMDPHMSYTSCNSLTSGKTCTPTCSAGYSLSASFTLVCVNTVYNASGVVCEPLTCTSGPSSNADPNADYTACNTNRSGDTCQPKCSSGYTLVGSFELLCIGSKYNASGATCKPDSCAAGPSSGADAHADYTNCNSLSSGESCTPACAVGYTVSGSFVLKCVTGGYDANGVTCVPNSCAAGPMGSIPSGANFTNCNAQRTGDTCTPVCASGYSLNNTIPLVCNASGYDVSQVGSCVAMGCSNGPNKNVYPNANYSRCDAMVTGQICVPDCAPGYVQAGSFPLLCVGGYYDALGAICNASTCTGGPKSNADGNAYYDSCNVKFTGDTCSPKCIIGYETTDSFTLTCTNTYYNASGAKCGTTRCFNGAYNAPPIADISLCSQLVTGGTCNPVCPGGYTTQSATVVCQANNTFDASSVACVPNTCSAGPTSSLESTAIYTACNTMKTGDVCVPACIAGFTAVGSISLVCDANRGYNASGAQCLPNSAFTCGPGPVQAAPYADYSGCNRLVTGQLCTPACQAGFTKTAGGSFTLKCTAGKYNDTSGIACVPNSCTNPNDPKPWTDYTPCNTLKSGDYCTPLCSFGYSTKGNFSLACLANGSYAAPTACAPNTCTRVQSPVTGADYSQCTQGKTTGDTCAVQCPAGYSPSGTLALTCDDTGAFASSITCNPNTCTAGPSSNANGNVDYTACNTLVSGQVCSPACYPGQGQSTKSITMTCDAASSYDASGASCLILCGTSTTPCPAVGQCRLTKCSGNTCTDTPKTDGTPCNDGSPATTNDKCTGGLCSGVNLCAGVVCTATNQCHGTGQCDPQTGKCSDPLKADGTPCDDGNPQTVSDSCQSGTCNGVNRCVGVTCVPSDQCRDAGVCDPTTGLCSEPPVADGKVCNDGNPATTSDQCVAGVCAGSIVCGSTVCPKPQQCHEYVCDGAVCKLVAVTDGTGCNDGNARTTADMCTSGVCAGTDKCLNVPCVLNQCQRSGLCDFTTGVTPVLNLPNGVLCDDEDPTTTGDTCMNGVCTGTMLCSTPCTALDQCHEVGICDTITGACSSPTKSDGTPCDDGNAATTNDVCTNGYCAGLILCTSDCRSVDQCHTAVCDGTGCKQLQRPDGASCVHPVFGSGKCASGVCTGNAQCSSATCTPPSQCHIASCNSAGNCIITLKPDFTPCNDGDSMTVSDQCLEGVCCGKPACGGNQCNPVSSCHYAGTCDVASGMCTTPQKPDGTPCDDKSNATINDVCRSGVCVGEASCVMGGGSCPYGTCQTPACNGTTCTQLWAIDGAFCDDSNPATADDKCYGGVCVGVDLCASVICTPSDQCHVAGVCTNGVCTNPTAPDGKLCDDGNPATSDDACKQGVCVGTDRCSSVVCVAPDDCHYPGACDPLAGFCSERKKPDGTACNDGDSATTGDVCVQGVCKGELACGGTLCSADQCYKPTCVGSACTQTPLPNGSPCNDGNPATSGDKCVNGLCTGVDLCSGVVCISVGMCYDAGACNSATGTCTAVAQATNTPCDDGNPETIEDVCRSGVCKGRNRCEGVQCASSDGCHYPGVCDVNTGLCSDPVKSDGSACNDNDPATSNDQCRAGVCAGTLVCGSSSCAATQPCQRPICDGQICKYALAPDNTPCNDNDVSTLNDACVQGVCKGKKPCQSKICPAISQCHRAGTCEPYTGKCTQPLQPDGTACDDGDATTTGDVCKGGVCSGRNKCLGVSCAPEDDCHNYGTCNPLTGLCTDVPKPDGTPCNDGNPATRNDICGGGVCVGSIQCGSAQCTPASQCETVACNGTCITLLKSDGTACDDGKADTYGDVCSNGVCMGTSRCANVACGAVSQCLAAGVCDIATGQCTYKNRTDNTPCDDGLPQSVGDRCVGGVCVGYDPCASVTCRSTDQCHAIGTCSLGVCSDPVLPDGTPCNDGDPSTQSDMCRSGVCTGSLQCNGITCRAANPVCHKSACTQGTCSQVQKPDGTLCSDGSSATQNDTCLSGVCTGTTKCANVVCAAIDQCHEVGTCQPALGTCSTPAKPDGTSCDDGDPKTMLDVCQAGLCIGTTKTCEAFTGCGAGFGVDKSVQCPGTGCTAAVCCIDLQTCNGVVCTASDQCHDVGVCDPATGLCSDPPKQNGATCSDESTTTVGDTCNAGVCAGYIQCGSSNCSVTSTVCRVPVCKNNVCSDEVVPDGTPCNDGNVSTAKDMCVAGKCQGEDKCSNVVCQQSDQCHDVGTCNPATGLCSDPAKSYGVPCNDGIVGTIGDKCVQGACVGVVPCGAVNCTSTRPQCYSAVCEGTKCAEAAKPDGTACNDGNLATADDRCQAGVCKGVDKCYGVVCKPMNQCYDSGLCYQGLCTDRMKPDGSPCDDGDATTTGDVCSFGVCSGKLKCLNVVCSTSDSCHGVGACDPLTGLCTDPLLSDGTACDDGDAQTTNDVCTKGVCKGGLTCGSGRCGTTEPCLRPVCSGTTCTTAPVADGTLCNDNDPTTMNDRCTSGKCSGVSKCANVVCFAISQCYDVACDPATGSCTYPAKANYSYCDDRNVYTFDDVCLDGVCSGTAQCASVQCSASPSACLTSGCDKTTGICSYSPVPDGRVCDDGVSVTTSDSCVSGNCIGSVMCAESCLSTSQCLAPSCVANKCLQVQKPDGTSCFDFSVSRPGSCQAGVCVPESDPCAGVICYPLTQCYRAGVCKNGNCTTTPLPDGTPCDDGNPATGKDVCRTGICSGSDLCAQVTCASSGQCYDAGVCNPSTGLCSEPPSPDGTSCDDGDVTTIDDKCAQGTCSGSVACGGAVCTTSLQCYTPECSANMCITIKSPDNTPCNDGNASTTGDKCVSGTCMGVDPCKTVTCPSGPCARATCTLGVCGVEVVPNGTLCDDRNSLTTRDQCMSGVCKGVNLCAKVTCTAVDQCHGPGVCDPTTGLCTEPQLPDGTACDDKNPTTPVDTCMGGYCVSTVPCKTTCRSPTTCTSVSCIADQCRIVPQADGTKCTDGNPATLDDTCQAGICVGKDLCQGVTCTVARQCVYSTGCNPKTGQCETSLKPDETPCDDGNDATISDRCTNGVCAGQSRCVVSPCTPTECRTSSCVSDSCVVANKADGTSCNDGNLGTTNDSCESGVCAGSITCKDTVCPKAAQCKMMTCNAGTCQETTQLDGSPCDDGDPTTTADSCTSGRCAGTGLCANVVCKSVAPCYMPGTCDPSTGICTTPLVPDNSFCDDGNAATYDDRCIQGTCTGTSLCKGVTCSPSDQCHTQNICNPLTGLCENQKKPDRTTCDDGNSMTTTDVCVDGSCRGEVSCAGSVCQAPDGCHSVLCTGTSCTTVALTDGSLCDDGSPKTSNDTCQGGTCVGVDPCAGVICNPIDQCHLAGVCLANGVCTNPVKPDMSPCDDGDDNTVPDQCFSGVCRGTQRCSNVVCSPSDQCHLAGVCDTASGLCSDPPQIMGTPCDDGLATTSNDQCLPGVGCTGTVACGMATCVPTGPCVYAVCNNTVCGEVPKANGVPCNDGNSSTTGDQCIQGACVGKNPCASLVCSAIDECHKAGVCDIALGVCTTPNRDDGTPCASQKGKCKAGACVVGDKCTGVVCQPSDQCHNAGVCDSSTGFCSDPKKADGILCDDGVLATTSKCVNGVCISSITCDSNVCSSQDGCHTVTCSGSTCVPVVLPNNTACNDGNVLSVRDTCQAGTCVGVMLCENVICSTPNNCLNSGTCDPRTGVCDYPPKADGTVCGNGQRCVSGVCTMGDICSGTACYPSSQCTAAGPCTASGGCSETTRPDGTPCDDSDDATVGDRCMGGVCVGVTKCADPCTLPDDCHTDAQCDNATGLCTAQLMPDGTACNDQNAASTSSECKAGSCIGSIICRGTKCTALDACHSAVCQGDLCTQVVKPDGSLCDDLNVRTANDQCVAGVCKGVDKCLNVVCNQVDSCHSAGTCDYLTGRCSAPMLPDGTPCGDEEFCKSGVCQGAPLTTCDAFNLTSCMLRPDASKVLCRTCNEAICCQKCSAFDVSQCSSKQLVTNSAVVNCPPGGCDEATCCAPDRCPNVVCSPSDGCHLAGVCDTLTGLCSDPQAADGKACDDNNPQTVNDQCTSGACGGTVMCGGVACKPIGECYSPYCDATGACAQRAKYDGSTCNDGNVATLNDVCSAGVCKGEDKCDGVICQPTSQCRAKGTCNPRTGICDSPPKADGVPCDDGNPDTVGDKCVSGSCGGVVVCGLQSCTTSSPECQVPVCVRGSCAVEFKDGYCDDGNPETFFDTCTQGRCVGVSKCAGVTCTKPDACHKLSECDIRTGLCVDVRLPDGTGCNDGNAATVNDQCQAGACISLSLCNGDLCRPIEPQCHVATCENNVCVRRTAYDGLVCNDNNPRTVDDKCRNGQCVGTDLCAKVVCNDVGPCSLDGVCDPMNGLCSYPAKQDGAVCDDGNSATVNDMCQYGVCVGTVTCSTSCKAVDACHVASCTNGRCVQTIVPNGAPCDDRTSSTINDKCTNGICLGDDICAGVTCSASDQCHSVGTCRGGACIDPPMPVGQSCDDGNPLTSNDKCVAGTCVGGLTCGTTPCRLQNIKCAISQCQGDQCIEVVLPDGTPCNDENQQTTNDVCVSGKCVGNDLCFRKVCIPGDTCHTSTCNPVDGTCIEELKPERTACDDGNPATSSDMCLSGVCRGTLVCGTTTCTPRAPVCSKVVACANSTCVEVTVDDGTPCNDGDVNTVNDVCTAGKCAGANLCSGVSCASTSPCQQDGKCDPQTGKCTSPLADTSTTCSDGSALTEYDRCQNGVCTGSLKCGSTYCVPTNPQCSTMQCTANACLSQPLPDGTSCNDNKPYTVEDKCVRGVCMGTDLCDMKTCPSTPCTVGVCNPQNGTCTDAPAPEGTGCGQVNGTMGVCRKGVCVVSVLCANVICTPSDPNCMYAVCERGQCKSVPKPDGSSCNDGDAATTGDVCTAGVCTGINKCKYTTCTSRPCHTSATCDPASGLCTDRFLVDGTSCNDNDPTTSPDTCLGGVCVGAPNCTATCPVSKPCFRAGCFNGQCNEVAMIENSQCDDAKPTTQDDRCVRGICKGTDRCASVTCSARTECEQDTTCNPSTGMCYARPVKTDGTPCSGGSCLQGVCVQDVVCGSTKCNVTAPTCKKAVCNGASCAEVNVPDYTWCDDGRDATVYDVCKSGVCVGQDLCAGVVCKPLSECHEAGVCSPLTGICSAPMKSDGSACNDGIAATVSERCIGGRCLDVLSCGGVPCASKSQCTSAFCLNESCVHQVVSDGTPCDDRVSTTFDDVCLNGICTGQDYCASKTCPRRECLKPAGCDPRTGLCIELPAPNGSPCNDGDPTTTNDTCLDGVCAGRVTCNGALCDRPPQCKTMTCSGNQCTLVNAAPKQCYDGNSETVNDMCNDGTCAGTDQCNGVVCSSQGTCRQAGSCIPSTGKCSSPAKAVGSVCNTGAGSDAVGECSGYVCLATISCNGDMCPPHDAECTRPTCSPGCSLASLPDKTPCSRGECSSGQCVDTNVCPFTTCKDTDCMTSVKCDPASQTCKGDFVSDGQTCSDLDVLTTTDTCSSGVCVGTVSCNGVKCPIPAECMYATCDASGNCITLPRYEGTLCSGGTCSSGKCGVPDMCKSVTCNSANVCVKSSCDPGTGLCYEQALSSSPCNDGNPDTIYDICVSGVCKGQLICGATLCKPISNCMTVKCDGPACVQVKMDDGAACNDGNPTTVNDVCKDGVCLGVTDSKCAGVSCEPSSQCMAVGQCTGGVCTKPLVADGRVCDDGNKSTTNDLCFAGVCVGASRCTEGNLCIPTDPQCKVVWCEGKTCRESNRPDGAQCGTGTCVGGRCTVSGGSGVDECQQNTACGDQACVDRDRNALNTWECWCAAPMQGFNYQQRATCASPVTPTTDPVVLTTSTNPSTLETWKAALASNLRISPTRINATVNSNGLVTLLFYGAVADQGKVSNSQPNDGKTGAELMAMLQDEVVKCPGTTFCTDNGVSGIHSSTTCGQRVVQLACEKNADCSWTDSKCMAAAAVTDSPGSGTSPLAIILPIVLGLLCCLAVGVFFARKKRKPEPAAKPPAQYDPLEPPEDVGLVEMSKERKVSYDSNVVNSPSYEAEFGSAAGGVKEAAPVRYDPDADALDTVYGEDTWFNATPEQRLPTLKDRHEFDPFLDPLDDDPEVFAPPSHSSQIMRPSGRGHSPPAPNPLYSSSTAYRPSPSTRPPGGLFGSGKFVNLPV